ncbi:MAG: hypothetical protein AAFQ82_01045 [Myxococcota bacterium]
MGRRLVLNDWAHKAEDVFELLGDLTRLAILRRSWTIWLLTVVLLAGAAFVLAGEVATPFLYAVF